MRIAVIDHVGNFGGGSRVLRGLLRGFKEANPAIEITFFCNQASITREGLADEFVSIGINSIGLQSLKLGNDFFSIRGSGRGMQLLQRRFLTKLHFLPAWLSGDVASEIEKRIVGFDVAFFIWPFFLRFPKLSCPVVGTFHDFNYKYFFGTNIFSKDQVRQLESDHPVWLENCTAVVSTHFMARELVSFYPNVANAVRVVHLASPSVFSEVDTQAIHTVTRKLGISSSYVIYPTNGCPHKNVVSAIAAIAILREWGYSIQLVLTGPDMDERVTGVATKYGVRRDLNQRDVVGLGYVSNFEIDTLIQGAQAVISTSLYEAGCGPGLDAWARAVPVAMSNIQAFVEHIDLQGVKAKIFDPRNPVDIAQSIRAILDFPEAAKEDGRLSQQALRSLTWKNCGAHYLEVFLDVIEKDKND